jgi:hypothetical protein
MKRTAMLIAMLVSGGLTIAAQEPASPVKGGKTTKAKTMTAVGTVKTVTADSLTISDGAAKDWTFVIDAKTKIIPPSGQETLDVTPASPVKGGKTIPSKALTITDIKEGQRVQVNYHDVNGKMHATQVRMM